MQGRLKREGKERQESMEEKDRQERVEEKDRQERMEEKDRTGKVKFDVTEYLKLVFSFQDADAEKCFLSFEKVAGNVKWPTDS